MRPDDLHHSRTRNRATVVMIAVVVFHLLLLVIFGGIAALLVYAVTHMFEEGRYPLKSIWKLALMLLVLLQALTMRVPLTSRSKLIYLQAFPGLMEALGDAAMRVNAEMPKAIRLTVAARIFAREEGGLLWGVVRPRRLLMIGVAALPYLSETELRVLLARALARWSKHETWYGVQARRVDLASEFLVKTFGSATLKWISPFYWLFVGFRAAVGKAIRAYVQERDLWADQMAAQA